MNPLQTIRFVAFTALLLQAASAAIAADGVLEINGACVNTGCFSGDSTGYPVEISQPGSYRLTSNIEVNQNTTAIHITADDVTLDLNGFAIRGPTTCDTTVPPTCSNTGIGIGIKSDGANTIVKNGIVSGTGSDCLELNDSNVRVFDLSIFECGDHGLFINAGLVERVTASRISNTAIGTMSGAGVAYVRDSFVRLTFNGVIAGECDNVVVQAADNIAKSCTAID